MKKLISFLLILALSITSFGQSNPVSTPLGKADYLQKSKTQKTAAWVLLAAGTTTLVIISNGNTALGSVGPLTICGAAAVLGSIPLFLASVKINERQKPCPLH